MHYNEGADLLTYLVDPSVFGIKDGYVEALQGASWLGRSHFIFRAHHTGPGLGIEINEQLVREYAEKYGTQEPWINAVWTGEDGSLREW